MKNSEKPQKGILGLNRSIKLTGILTQSTGADPGMKNNDFF